MEKSETKPSEITPPSASLPPQRTAGLTSSDLFQRQSNVFG
jgi:hypothetical protein